MTAFIILMLIHIVSIGIVVVSVHNGRQGINPSFFYIMPWLPLSGIFTALAFKSLVDCSEHVHEHSPEGLLRNCSVQTDETVNIITVPLDEAMLMNSPKVQRKLIFAMLQQEPDAYLAFLRSPYVMRDVEAAHYASTAAAKLQEKYEKRLYAAEEG